MDRCTLCGGRIANGRCTECGFDNTKNDKKYSLNTHNEKGKRLHEGSCESNLNRRNPPASGASAKAGKKQPSGSTQRSALSSEKVVQRTETKKTVKVQSEAERRRQLKKRSQTGTIKKKKRHFGWIVVLIIAALNVIPQALEELPYDLRQFLENLFVEEEDVGTPVREKEIESTIPLAKRWDTADPGYYEELLTPGIYTAGYEFPAGTYQFRCSQGTAWIDWSTNQGLSSGYAYLVSEEERRAYQEENGEEDSYYEYSETVTFETGDFFLIESCDVCVEMKGIGEGVDSLLSRTPQQLPEKTVLKGEMAVGTDVQPGVYDIILDQSYDGAEVVLYKNGEDGEVEYSFSFFLSPEVSRVRFLPLQEGNTIVGKYLEEDETLLLVPSY